MKPVSRTLFLIHARLGSERVVQKMIRPFAGTTLLDIALAKVRDSQEIPAENFYLSVHEPELIAIGERHGVQIFHRSAASAASEGRPLGALYEWWDQLDYDYCVLISACAPLLSVATIDAFVRRYLESECEGLFGVIEKHNYFWNEAGKMLTPAPAPGSSMNTKRVPVTHEAAHCLYAGRMDTIGDGIWMGTFSGPGDPELHVVPEEEAYDIDYPHEFELCEQLYTMRASRTAAAGEGT